MNTQKTILGYLNFLVSKKEEITLLKNIENDYDKIRLFNSILEDYNTLIEQSSLAIKSLQIDNYNLDEHIAILKEDNKQLKAKLILHEEIIQRQNENKTKQQIDERERQLNNFNNINNTKCQDMNQGKLNYIFEGSGNSIQQKDYRDYNINNNQNEYIPNKFATDIPTSNLSQEKGKNITFSKNDIGKDAINKKYVFEDIADENEDDDNHEVNNHKLGKVNKPSGSLENHDVYVEIDKNEEYKGRSKVSLRLKLKDNNNKINNDSKTDKKKSNKENNVNTFSSGSERASSRNINLLTKEVLSNLDDMMLYQVSPIAKKYNYSNVKLMLGKIENYEVDEDFLISIINDINNLKHQKSRSNEKSLNDTTKTKTRRKIHKTDDDKENRDNERDTSQKRSKSGKKMINMISDKDPYIDPLQFNRILRSYNQTPSEKPKAVPFKQYSSNYGKNFDKNL